MQSQVSVTQYLVVSWQEFGDACPPTFRIELYTCGAGLNNSYVPGRHIGTIKCLCSAGPAGVFNYHVSEHACNMLLLKGTESGWD